MARHAPRSLIPIEDHRPASRKPSPTPGRTPDHIAELAPGLTNKTPNAGQVTISGALAWDNVFFIDGVDVNDNLFGDAENVFIEDAVEETQVLTSGISAEYGRFSGGVINIVTKRGGNDFSGTFRMNFTNPAWVEETPFANEKRTANRESRIANIFHRLHEDNELA